MIGRTGELKSQFCETDVMLFDFGGVIAEEGFVKGLRAIADKHGLDEADFSELAHDLIHTSGYLTGRGSEHEYWQAVRDKTGIGDSDGALRREILSRFILRPWMLEIVDRIRASGARLAILSDQTNWLEELNERDHFSRHFDLVFNSYCLGKSKVDPSLFSDILLKLGSAPGKVLFIDDKKEHCERARQKGIHSIHFKDRDSFMQELEKYCPGISSET